jgi:hypothetical protein
MYECKNHGISKENFVSAQRHTDTVIVNAILQKGRQTCGPCNNPLNKRSCTWSSRHWARRSAQIPSLTGRVQWLQDSPLRSDFVIVQPSTVCSSIGLHPLHFENVTRTSRHRPLLVLWRRPYVFTQSSGISIFELWSRIAFWLDSLEQRKLFVSDTMRIVANLRRKVWGS